MRIFCEKWDRRMSKISSFTRFARTASNLAGRPITFICAVALLLGWAITGPLFAFSDTWQLVINTGTTIITFLMVFLIQNTQNRDTEALQIKLDEIIRANRSADNELLDLEELDDAELTAIHKRYVEMAEHAHRHLEGRRTRR